MAKKDDEFDSLPPAKNDVIPPWEAFPDYERYTIGWRMGDGESYLGDWWNFLESLPSDYKNRLKYLKRNRPAPVNWFNTVLEVLYPNQNNNNEHKDSNSEITSLLKLGLIRHDVAFETWLQKQTAICWPWTLSDTPEEMARYRTREFWFFSRQFKNHRNIEIPIIPNGWKHIEFNLVSGKLGDIDTNKGLQTLSKMFCTGDVLTPWQLGLNPDDFTDSFEMNMGYTDAYRLWLMSAFDDDKLIRTMLAKTVIPKEWNDWIEEEIEYCSFNKIQD